MNCTICDTLITKYFSSTECYFFDVICLTQHIIVEMVKSRIISCYNLLIKYKQSLNTFDLTFFMYWNFLTTSLNTQSSNSELCLDSHNSLQQNNNVLQKTRWYSSFMHNECDWKRPWVLLSYPVLVSRHLFHTDSVFYSCFIPSHIFSIYL